MKRPGRGSSRRPNKSDSERNRSERSQPDSSRGPQKRHQKLGRTGAKNFKGSSSSHRPIGARAQAREVAKPGRWVVGVHSCEEAIKVRPHAVAEAWFRPDWEDSLAHRKMAEVLLALEIPILAKSQDQIATIGSGHQGIAMRVTETPEINWNSLEGPGPHLLLILDGIEDPHNLGSILRTAWLMGTAGILIPEDRATGLTPAVCKVASGGAEHVPVETHVNFGPVVKRLKDIGFWVYGLTEKGQHHPSDLSLSEKVVWVVGNEGTGLRISTERLCDELVKLPQVQSGSSYNAGVAAAIALYETCRQIGKPQ